MMWESGEGAGGDSRSRLTPQPGGSTDRSEEIPVPGHSWGDEPDSKADPESADATMDVVEGGTGKKV